MLKCDKCGQEYDYYVNSCEKCGAKIKAPKDMLKWSELSIEEQGGLYHKIKSDTFYHNPYFGAAIFFLIFFILNIIVLIAISFINYDKSDAVDTFLNLISLGGILYLNIALLVLNMILFIVFISISISNGKESLRNKYPILLFQNGVYYDL